MQEHPREEETLHKYEGPHRVMCYDKHLCNNKPPFLAIVTALVQADVSYIGIVKAGMRWKIHNPILNVSESLFDDISTLRDQGIRIEVQIVDFSVTSTAVKNVASSFHYISYENGIHDIILTNGSQLRS